MWYDIFLPHQPVISIVSGVVDVGSCILKKNVNVFLSVSNIFHGFYHSTLEPNQNPANQ